MSEKIYKTDIDKISAEKFKRTRINIDGEIKNEERNGLKAIISKEARGGIKRSSLKKIFIDKFKIIGDGKRIKERNQLYETIAGEEKKLTYEQMSSLKPEELSKLKLDYKSKCKLDRFIKVRKFRNVFASQSTANQIGEQRNDPSALKSQNNSTRITSTEYKYRIGVNSEDVSSNDYRGNKIQRSISAAGNRGGIPSAQGVTGATASVGHGDSNSLAGGFGANKKASTNLNSGPGSGISEGGKGTRPIGL